MKKTQVVKLFDYTESVKDALKVDGLRKSVLAGGEVIRNEAKINIRKTFSKRSRGGAGLAGSMLVLLVKSTNTVAEADVGPTKVYGRIQELGGVIRPLVKKILSWVDPETGVRMFAKKVTIPARPYLRPAMDEHKSEILKAMGVQFKATIVKACKGK